MLLAIYKMKAPAPLEGLALSFHVFYLFKLVLYRKIEFYRSTI